MIEIVPFKAEHMKALEERRAAAAISEYLRADHLAALEASDHAFTAFEGDRIVGCAGVVRYWKGRGEAWAMVDRRCSVGEFVQMRNAIRRFLEVSPYRRIEAIVGAAFAAGQRWAASLGFEVEAPRLRSYLPDGSDAVMFVRLAEEGGRT